jgi:hypothetical protein
MAENLCLFRQGLNLNSNFSSKIERNIGTLTDMPAGMFGYVLSEIFGNVYHSEESFGSFYAESFTINDSLFELISTSVFLQSIHRNRLLSLLGGFAFMISSDMELLIDDDEDEGKYDDFDSCDDTQILELLLSSFDGDSLEFYLYYTDDLSNIAVQLEDIKNCLWSIKEELNVSQNEIAA